MKNKVFNIFIIIVDLVLINLGFYVAFLMKFNFNPPSINIEPYIKIIPLITIAALLYFDFLGLLSVFRKSLYDTIYSTIMAVLLLAMTTISITYINQGFSFPRSILLTAPIIQIMLLIIWKIAVWEWRKYILDTKKVVIVGSNKEEIEMVKIKIAGPAKNLLLEIKSTCDASNLNDTYKHIGSCEQVFICSSIPDEKKEKIIGYCLNNDKGIYIIPGLSDIFLYKAQMLHFDDIGAFAVEDLKFSPIQRFIKRSFDILFSSFAIVILSPVLLIACIAVKVSSKGPIFYFQERVTRDGKVFKLVKFRTMIDGAEELTGPTLAKEKDTRITPIGRVLRQYRIDELPQFINVLMGTMSVVGPRPERPFFVKQFSKEIPGYKYRTHVKAGITGLAQIIGKYSTEPEDKLRYDLLYIRNFSVLFDVKIILQTINIVLHRKGFESTNVPQMFEKELKKALH